MFSENPLSLRDDILGLIVGDAIIDMTFADELIWDDLSVRVGQEIFLLTQESFGRCSVKFVSPFANFLKFATGSLFEYFESILHKLAI